MKVKGINNAYSVEIKKLGKGISVTLSENVGLSMMAVTISKENWKKLKEGTK